MKGIAIVSGVMKQDKEKIARDKKIENLDLIFMEEHLHDTRDIMRQKLQEQVSNINSDYDKIILGQGLCSNGVTGIMSWWFYWKQRR